MRLFNKRQKKFLKLISGNLCSICKSVLEKDFHADHIKPYSKRGLTTLKNGQAVCPKCNLSKGVNDE